MAVFPETMNRLDAQDVAGSLQTLENYVGYICERVEFANRNMTRSVENAGISSVEVYLLLTEVRGQTQALQSALSSLSGSVSALESAVNALEGRVTAAEGSLTALEGRVTAAEDGLTALESRVTAAEDGLAALEGRVTALEGQED